MDGSSFKADRLRESQDSNLEGCKAPEDLPLEGAQLCGGMITAKTYEKGMTAEGCGLVSTKIVHHCVSINIYPSFYHLCSCFQFK